MKRQALAFLASAILMAGCTSRVDIVPISGTLTYQGKPMPYVFLRFVPDDGAVKSTSMAVTDEQGRFTMMIGSVSGVYRGTATVFCDDPLAATGSKTDVGKEVEGLYREFCAKFGKGKAATTLTIDRPDNSLVIALE